MSLNRQLLCRSWCARASPHVAAARPLRAERSREVHTSERRQSIEVAVSLGLGFAVNANWQLLPSAVKIASCASPLVMAALLLRHIRKRTLFDPWLGRNKLILRQQPTGNPPAVQYMTGQGVDKANELLYEIISANAGFVPGLKHEAHQWKLLVAKEGSVWLDTGADGTLICSMALVTGLSRNELIVFLSTLVAHVIAKHKAEISSYAQVTTYFGIIAAWYYGFNAPVLYSYPADIAVFWLMFASTQFIMFQIKFRKLCVEADVMALVLSSSLGATPADALSMMRKMLAIRSQMPLRRRFRALCHYQYRISHIEKKIAEKDKAGETVK